MSVVQVLKPVPNRASTFKQMHGWTVSGFKTRSLAAHSVEEEREDGGGDKKRKRI